MRRIVTAIARYLQQARDARRHARGLRELELLDQVALNDLGMSRGALVSMSYGKRAGRCAHY